MTRLLWATDLHLSFLAPGGAKKFGQSIAENMADLAVITGDIAEGRNFDTLIEEFAEGLDKPVYVILGNHDYYGTSIETARHKAAKMSGKAQWLTNKSVKLSEKAILLGVDGFYDGRLGDAKRSQVVLNDFHHIKEFRGLHTQKLFDKIAEVADIMAAEAEVTLVQAVSDGYKQVIFATHVPPFAQAAWHEGAMSDKHWLPWMSSRIMGETLAKVARANPDVDFLVLCGHTHSPGEYQHMPNLKVLTGESAYRFPRVSKVLEF